MNNKVSTLRTDQAPKQLHCIENTYIVGSISLSQQSYNEFQQDEKQVHSITPLLRFDPFTLF